MNIFVNENIISEKRDYLKENEIVFEILTIVKNGLKILAQHKKNEIDELGDEYHPYNEEYDVAYQINKNCTISLFKNKIQIQIDKLKSFEDFTKIHVVFFVSDYVNFVGDYQIMFKDYFDPIDIPNFKMTVGVPDNNDIGEIINLLNIINSKRCEEVLIHEIEHMLQSIRLKYHEYPYHHPNNNREKYFNQTSEVEAHVAQILRNNIKNLKGHLKNLTKGYSLSASEMRELIQNYSIISYKIFYGINIDEIELIPQKHKITNKKVIKRFLKFADKEIKRAYIQTIQSFIK